MALVWTDIEIKLIIEDYFSMLRAEFAGESFNKAHHRKALLPLVNSRSKGSIEFKHQNISAVLSRLGQPYIRGYLPRYNYQRVLEDKVLDYLIGNRDIEDDFRMFSDKEVVLPELVAYDNLIVDAPTVD